MRKILSFSPVLSLLVLLLTPQLPALAENAIVSREQAYLPEPLVSRLSAYGNELVHGVPLKAVIKDPNPAPALRRIPVPEGLSTSPETATASFSITYVPNGGTDAWGEQCYTFPEEAKAAFDAAANIWANILNSSVPITIQACWADMGSSTTLGYSGGGVLHANFTGANLLDTWHSASLANALSGEDLSPIYFDMYITYNRNFTWYYGTDGNTPTHEYDLMTVVLHEITHGLNFSGSMSYSSGLGSYGYGTDFPDIYDVFMLDGSGVGLIDYPNPSTALGSALVSDNIWFNGSRAMAANGDQQVKMYTPGTWSSGSSYSHLDYNTFNGTADQLMVYAISSGESIHDPGAITTGLLRDMGWPALPVLTTGAVTDITATSAMGHGTLTDSGSPNPTEHGVCWNTSGTPDTGDTCTDEGAAASSGAFTSQMSGLLRDTTYYVRAYATNGVGTSYGEQVSFTTTVEADSALLLYLPAIINNAKE